MRARRREINIFNMSLLDILCGALGAFCFMVLVMLPSYKTSSGDAQSRENHEKTQELMRDIEKMKERMSEATAAADLDDLLRRLQAQIQSLEGQVNRLTAENQQLTAANDKQKLQLAQKKPFFMISMATDETQDVDLYLEDDMIPEGGNKRVNPPFDPAKPRHISNWTNDSNAWINGRGVAVWMTSDVPVAAHYRFYLKLASEPSARRSTVLKSFVFGDIGEKMVLPEVPLTPQRFWALVGIFTVDANHHLTFKEATPTERDAEWKAIAKTAPPPVTLPTAVPSNSPVNNPADMLERMRKAPEQRQSQQPQAAPAPSAKP